MVKYLGVWVINIVVLVEKKINIELIDQTAINRKLKKKMIIYNFVLLLCFENNIHSIQFKYTKIYKTNITNPTLK